MKGSGEGKRELLALDESERGKKKKFVRPFTEENEKSSGTINSFQDCDCKHPHFISKYSLKKNHSSLLKKNKCPPTEKVIKTLYSDLNIRSSRLDERNQRQTNEEFEKTKRFTSKIRNFIKIGFNDSKEEVQYSEPTRFSILFFFSHSFKKLFEYI